MLCYEIKQFGADVRFVTTVEKNLNALRLVEIARRVGAQHTGKLLSFSWQCELTIRRSSTDPRFPSITPLETRKTIRNPPK
jgi:hypothetical protein